MDQVHRPLGKIYIFHCQSKGFTIADHTSTERPWQPTNQLFSYNVLEIVTVWFVLSIGGLAPDKGEITYPNRWKMKQTSNL